MRPMSLRRNDFADPTVAASTASPGVSPISRTARAMTNGIDDE